MARCTDIRSSGLTGERACNCCAAAAARGASRVGQLVLTFLSSALEGKADVDLWLDPQLASSGFVQPNGKVVQVPTTNPVIRGVPSGGVVMGVGAIALLFGLVAEDIAAEARVQTLVGLLADAIPPMVGAARKYAEGSCEVCVRESLWGQSTPRVVVTERHQKRV